jgi:hypothetical protein
MVYFERKFPSMPLDPDATLGALLRHTDLDKCTPQPESVFPLREWGPEHKYLISRLLLVRWNSTKICLSCEVTCIDTES